MKFSAESTTKNVPDSQVEQLGTWIVKQGIKNNLTSIQIKQALDKVGFTATFETVETKIRCMKHAIAMKAKK